MPIEFDRDHWALILGGSSGFGLAAATRLARRKLVSPVAGTVQQVYYRPGEMVPAGRPVLALLPPENIKVRFYVPEAMLAKIALGEMVKVQCDGCAADIAARISFISDSAEFTPPVIYSLEERSKLVFLVEARPERPERLRAGQPVSGAGRAIDRDPGPGPVRGVRPGHPVGGHVQAMIAVQVAKADRVDIEQADMPLQGAECPVAEVNKQPEPFGLDQVAGSRAVGPGEAASASDHGQPHGHPC